jgi:hypothetical protein
MAAGASTALQRFELENNVQAVSDGLFEYDEAAHLALCEKKPWKSKFVLSLSLSLSLSCSLLLLSPARNQPVARIQSC